MVNIKRKSKELYNWAYFPFVVLFIGMMIFHLIIRLNYGDDLLFKEVLNENKILDWLKLRYMTWSSRLVIECVMVSILSTFTILWKMLDVLIVVLLGVSISKLFLDSNIRRNNWTIVGLIFIYPIADMCSAGWAATTLNYLWPLSLGLYSFIIIKKIFNGNKVKWYEYICSTLSLIFAANQEQMCSVLLGIYGLLCLYFLLKHKSKIYIFFQTFLCLGSFIFILTCPGNALRKGTEISTWFPDYNMLTLANKLELGFTSAMDRFLFKPNMIFIIFSIVIAIATIKRCEDIMFRIISLVPLVGSLILPSIPKFSGAVTKYGVVTIDNFNSLKSYLPIIALAVVGICSLLTLCFCFDNSDKMIITIYIFLLGFASRMVMAFSPTIWASGNRTYLFMDFSIIICTIVVCNETFKSKFENNKILNYLIGLLAMASFMNNVIDRL